MVRRSLVEDLCPGLRHLRRLKFHIGVMVGSRSIHKRPSRLTSCLSATADVELEKKIVKKFRTSLFTIPLKSKGMDGEDEPLICCLLASVGHRARPALKNLQALTTMWEDGDIAPEVFA
jgi:hypothetical protein